MAKVDETISIRAYAKLLGISDRTVRLAIQNGTLKKGVVYFPQMQAGKEITVPSINVEIADKEWGNVHKTGKVKPGQNKIKKLQLADGQNGGKTQKKSTQQGAYLPPETDEPDEISPEDEKRISELIISRTLPHADILKYIDLLELVMLKRKLQELEATLIKKETVEKALYSFGVEFKKALLNIPARITALIRSAANDVEAQNILINEITDTLNHFSNFNELKI